MKKMILLLVTLVVLSASVFADGSDPMPLCRHGRGPHGEVCVP